MKKKIFRYLTTDKAEISPQDLDSSYIIKDNKIYLVGVPEKELSRGFPFKVVNDTIYFHLTVPLEYPLSKNAFLRKIKNDHIVNIKQQNQWWEPIFLKRDSNGTIYICQLNAKKLESFSNHTHVYSYKQEYSRHDYFEANWKTKELLNMIHQGVFSDTIIVLKSNERLRKRLSMKSMLFSRF